MSDKPDAPEQTEALETHWPRSGNRLAVSNWQELETLELSLDLTQQRFVQNFQCEVKPKSSWRRRAILIVEPGTLKIHPSAFGF